LDLPDLSAELYGSSALGVSRTSRSEARAALSELGYGPEEIRGALDGLRDDVGVEEMLRLALRELAGR
jgi:Holliday junction resolvasome RuvABC DNA-binding subunit